MNLQQSLSALKEELAKAEQTLRSMAGKPILNGRDSVRKVLQIFRDKGKEHAKTAGKYHGLVIENFKCEQSIYTAVEVTSVFLVLFILISFSENSGHGWQSALSSYCRGGSSRNANIKRDEQAAVPWRSHIYAPQQVNKHT